MEEEEHGERASRIPPELVLEIGKRLESRLDILRFRSVCHSWRSNLPPPSLFPLRISLPPTRSSKSSQTSESKSDNELQYFITEETGYAIDHSELVVFEELCHRGRRWFRSKRLFSDKDVASHLNMDRINVTPLFRSSQLRMALETPMSPQEQQDFYWQQRMSQFRRRFRLITEHEQEEFHWKQLMLEFNRRLITQQPEQGAVTHKIEWFSDTSPGVDKIVLVSTLSSNTGLNPNYAAMNYGSGCISDLCVVALLAGGQLRLLRLISSDYSVQSTVEWETIDFDYNNSRLDDIVNYRGQLVGVDCHGGAFVLDYKSMKMTQYAPSPIYTDTDGRTFVSVSQQLIVSPLYECHLHPVPAHLRHTIPRTPVRGRKRLVEASGDLYLLLSCRVPELGAQSKIKVFQLLLLDGKRVWVEINALPCDQAFVVERNFSFSTLPARDIFSNHGRKGNCIFLHGLSFTRNNDEFDYPLFPDLIDSPSVGIYNLEDDDSDDQNPNFRKISAKNCPEIFY